MTQYNNNKIDRVEWLFGGGMWTIGIVYCRDIVTDQIKVYIGSVNPLWMNLTKEQAEVLKDLEAAEAIKEIAKIHHQDNLDDDIKRIIDWGTKFEDDSFKLFLDSLKNENTSQVSQLQ